METGRKATSRRFYSGDSRFVHEPSGRFGMDAAYHKKPSVTLERLSRLERVMLDEINELRELTSRRLE